MLGVGFEVAMRLEGIMALTALPVRSVVERTRWKRYILVVKLMLLIRNATVIVGREIRSLEWVFVGN